MDGFVSFLWFFFFHSLHLDFWRGGRTGILELWNSKADTDVKSRTPAAAATRSTIRRLREIAEV